MVTVQKGRELGQRDVLLRLDRTQHNLPERLDAMRPEISALGLRRSGAGRVKRLDPPDRGSDPDAKPLGCGPTS